ncbi:hypothetical protein [Chelativorans sp. AA-79]|uniref:hypothetical protein n=1 Tax=Chelativorans sp. AA-79 TaxID=3028735 RepID=UPI0023F623ED|nr:hypothetical protein [Chelativorans sp. AA-79]WEX10560.1 hypothetical protein PVE73_06275 [Chelativorans sp. AA-79]
MSSPLMDIREGMRVTDVSGKEIGTVEWVHFSDEDPETPQAETVTPGTVDRTGKTLLEQFADVFRIDNVPEVLHERMMREGFVRLDADGLFAADRYILPDQIRSVSGDGVVLNVARDELIKS